jgi:hypothetical protein
MKGNPRGKEWKPGATSRDKGGDKKLLRKLHDSKIMKQSGGGDDQDKGAEARR